MFNLVCLVLGFYVYIIFSKGRKETASILIALSYGKAAIYIDPGHPRAAFYKEAPLTHGSIELADMIEAALVAEANSELHRF